MAKDTENLIIVRRNKAIVIYTITTNVISVRGVTECAVHVVEKLPELKVQEKRKSGFAKNVVTAIK